MNPLKNNLFLKTNSSYLLLSDATKEFANSF